MEHTISVEEWDAAHRNYYVERSSKNSVLEFSLSLDKMLSNLQESGTSKASDLAQLGIMLALTFGHLQNACTGDHSFKVHLVRAQKTLSALNTQLLSGGQLDNVGKE